MNFYALMLTLTSALIVFGISYTGGRMVIQHQRWISHYFKRKKEEALLSHHLPSLLLQLSSFLSCGHAFPQALTYISGTPSGQALHQALKAKKPSVTLPTLDFMLQFLKLSISLSGRSGLALSEILKKSASLTKAQLYFEEKKRTLLLPLRIQITVALSIPWGVLLIFALMDPLLIQEAVGSFWGGVGFSTALCLEILSLIWIRRIIT